jgi:hypothetical protein
MLLSYPGTQPNPWMPNLVNNLSATGSSSVDAYPIPTGQDLSVFTSVSAGQGCALPGLAVTLGEKYEVANDTPVALLVYPPSPGGVLGAASPGVGFSVPGGSTACFTNTGYQRWTTNA